MKQFRIGDLKERVTIQQVKRISDGQGGWTEEWTDVITVWAQIMEQTNVSQSKEYHTAEQRLPVTTHRVRIRYLQGMSSDKRLVWGQKLPGTTLDSDITLDSADEMDGNSRARILEIRSVIDEDARKRTMIMFCDEIGVKSGG